VFYTYAPSLYLFGILDALLVIRLVHVGGMCDSPRWRAIYTTIAAGFAIWFVSDTLAGLENASVVRIISDGMYNVLHFAPFFIMMAAVSIPARPSDGAIEPRGMFERRSAGGVTGQLLVYAMILPLVHLSMYSAGLLDGRTGPARTALVLLVAAAFLGLAEIRRRRMLTGRDGSITVVVSDEELAQVQRMEALGRLAGGVAHDFSNLLTAIRGYSELGMGDASHDERVDFFRQIRMTTERGKALTSQLLAFSRKQVFEVKPVDLNRVIDEARDMLARLLGADVSLVTQLDRNLGRVNGEPGQLLQVVVNLVVNAREAMPDGGTVTIRTANVELERGDGASGGAPAGSFVLLEVADTGCGMDSETRRRAFEPFFTTRGHGDGTGLGLATVYGIVRQCGGAIHADSEPGQGTVMHVFLPRSVGAAGEGAAPPALVPTTSAGNETILLAEDEPSVREVTGRYLSGLGYDVLVVANGLEAMQVVRHRGRAIDLLVTDVVMPGAGGRQLASDLDAVQPGVRVVYMSGHVDVAAESFTGAGVNFIQKPFSLTELGQVVRRALDGDRRIAPGAEGADRI
jgi:signal transduction histidine kinase